MDYLDNQQQNQAIDEFEFFDDIIVPPGQYVALFKGAEKTNHEQWGEGVMFVFEICDGEYKGCRVTRIGKPKASPKNATGKILMGMCGHIEHGQRVSIKRFIDEPFGVVVEPANGGKTRIATVFNGRSSAPARGFQTPPTPPQQQPTGFKSQDYVY